MSADPRHAERMMGAVLRPGASLAAEYPLIFERGFAGAVVAAQDRGEALSACALLPRTLIDGGTQIAAGLIGSVATHPEHRGRGLATQVLETAERELRRHGCLLALLWADEPAFYAARGWSDCGAELDFVLEPALRERLPWPAGVRPFQSSDAPALHALHERHPRRCQRTPAEMQALLGIPGMTVIVREVAGAPAAYACCDRGADLQGVVHEWAGGADDVLPLLRWLLERRLAHGDERPLVVMSPADGAGLRERLEPLGVRTHTGVLAMGKLLDVAGAAELAARLLDPRGSVRAHPDAGGPDRVTLEGPRGRWTGNPTELLDLLLPARGDDGRWRASAQTLGASSTTRPPQPFAWGLDSI